MPPKKAGTKKVASAAADASSSSTSGAGPSGTAPAPAPIIWTGKSVPELEALIDQLTIEMHEAAEPTREDYATALNLQNRIASLKSQLIEARAAEQSQADALKPPAPIPIKLEDALLEEPDEAETAPILESQVGFEAIPHAAEEEAPFSEQEARLRPWNVRQPPIAADDEPTMEELADKLAHGHLLTKHEIERLEKEAEDAPDDLVAEVASTDSKQSGGGLWSWSPFSFFVDKDGDGVDDNTGLSEAAAKAAGEDEAASPNTRWANRLERTVVAAAKESGEPVDPSSLWEPAPASVRGSVIDVGAVARYASLIGKAQTGDRVEPPSVAVPSVASATVTSALDPPSAATAAATAGPSGFGTVNRAAGGTAPPPISTGKSTGAPPPSPPPKPTGAPEAAPAPAPAPAPASAAAQSSKKKASAAAPKTEPAQPHVGSKPSGGTAKKAKPVPKPRAPKPPTPRPKGMPSREWYLEVLATGRTPQQNAAAAAEALAPPTTEPKPKKKGKKKA